MENINERTTRLIARTYEDYRPQVHRYIYSRINDWLEAEDMTQDVYLRLLECRSMLREETIKDFIFTIARNLITDYLRRYYKRQEVTSYIYDTRETVTNETESRILADDLAACERQRMRLLPPQRGKIYRLSRYEDKSVADISAELQLSVSTVENHLRISRKEVRAYMRQCI